MPADIWENDFRRDAIAASLAAQAAQPSGVEPGSYESPDSFCVPLVTRLNAGLTPGKLALGVLGVAVLLMGLGAYLIYWAEGAAMPAAATLAIGGGCIGLLGFSLLFIPSKMHTSVVKWFLPDRVRYVKSQAPGATAIGVEIAPGEQEKQEIAVDADDFAMAVFDVAGRRLMIEGLNCRYQIRADDVVSLQPFRFANYMGATFEFVVADGCTLFMAIAKPSLRLSTTLFLVGDESNKLLQLACETFDVPIDEAIANKGRVPTGSMPGKDEDDDLIVDDLIVDDESADDAVTPPPRR